MPTVKRIGPYRFHFYSKEAGEPPHIHAARDDSEAKFWLSPVRLAANYGFAVHELKRLREIVLENESIFKDAWDVFHGNS